MAILNAENVEIDQETLRLARQDLMLHKRYEAALKVVEAVEKGLSSEGKERYEAYLRANDPCYAEV